MSITLYRRADGVVLTSDAACKGLLFREVWDFTVFDIESGRVYLDHHWSERRATARHKWARADGVRYRRLGRNIDFHTGGEPTVPDSVRDAVLEIIRARIRFVRWSERNAEAAP